MNDSSLIRPGHCVTRQRDLTGQQCTTHVDTFIVMDSAFCPSTFRTHRKRPETVLQQTLDSSPVLLLGDTPSLSS